MFASVFLVGTKEPEELAFLVRMIFICVSGKCNITRHCNSVRHIKRYFSAIDKKKTSQSSE